MSIQITRRLDFCAGHRVAGHESKCRNLHGHAYSAFVKVQRPTIEATARASDEREFLNMLDDVGRVVDFAVVKARVGDWIDRHWDHKFLMWVDDPMLIHLEAVAPGSVTRTALNPTAENLAIILRGIAAELLAADGVEIVSIVIQETQNCWAEVL